MKLLIALICATGLCGCVAMSDAEYHQAKARRIAAGKAEVCEVWAGTIVRKCTKTTDVNRTIEQVNRAIGAGDTQHAGRY